MSDLDDDYDFVDAPLQPPELEQDLKPLAEAIQKALAPKPAIEQPKQEPKQEPPKVAIPIPTRRKIHGMM